VVGLIPPHRQNAVAPTIDQMRRAYRRAQREWAAPRGAEEIESAGPWIEIGERSSESVLREVRREKKKRTAYAR
jgi:hypothetical protein